MGNKRDKVALLFEDLSINSQYRFLEYGKDDEEIKRIASKRGITVPSKDLAFFKGKYAFVDEENRNGCTLPRKEVEKALQTLNGKAIDKDHFRKQTIGFWLESVLEKDTIYSYGAFWKSNFPEEYEDIQKRMSEGKMKISFEAWGDRQFRDDGSYDLLNIEFAGGALLFETEPAFPNAEVLELSSRQHLEFAKVLEGGLKIDSDIEDARLDFFYDQNNIARIISECECPTCEEDLMHDVMNIDFENSKIKHRCVKCGAVCETDLTPKTVLKKKGKMPKPVNPDIQRASDSPTETERKGKLDLAGNKEEKKEGGTAVDELLKKYSKASVEELIKFIDELQASGTVKDAEIATLKKTIEDEKLKVENAKIELEKVQVEAKAVKEQLDTRLAAEKAAAVKARRDELGEEFAKDISDEDIMNDLKFENAKLKKELASVKKATENASVKKEEGLEAGAKVKEKETASFTKQKNIQTKAFGKQDS